MPRTQTSDKIHNHGTWEASFITGASLDINGGLYFSRDITMRARLKHTPVIPVVVIEDAAKAVPVAQALIAGGLPIVEVTLRTAAALDAIAAIAADVPEAFVGAGTVLSSDQTRDAVSAGARFIVSPGLHEGVVSAAGDLSVPVVPGVVTASEVQRAWNLGLRVLKFFPAGQAGGIPMLKSLASVFRDVEFIPTGGVSAQNLGAYLEVPSVAACGGSWLTPSSAIGSGAYAEITRLAAESVAIANKARG